MVKTSIKLAALFLASAPVAFADGFAPADSFRTLTQVLPGKKAGEYSVTLRWAPVACVNGYAVHLARAADMARPKISYTGKRPFLTFPTSFAGSFYWQVGCRGDQSADDSGVETRELSLRAQYLPPVVPEALRRKVVRKEGSGDSLPLGGAAASYRHRLEVYSPRLELLSERESDANDAFWPSVGPGFYYYRVQSIRSDGQQTYATPFNVLQVEGGSGGAGGYSAAADRGFGGNGGGIKGVRVAAGIGFVGQTGTQTAATSTGVSGDLSSGTTFAFNVRAQWNISDRWALDFRGLFTKGTYNDASGRYVNPNFNSSEFRLIGQNYLPSGNKFWLLGAGLSSRNHPFSQILDFARLTVAGVRTMEFAVRGGVEWRPERWTHTAVVDILLPFQYSAPTVQTIKGSIVPSVEIELTSYYAFGPRIAVGGFVSGRLSNTKFAYTSSFSNEDVTLKFNRVTGGILGSYRF